MARNVLSYVGKTRTELLTLANAGLAALVNPNIRSWQFDFRDRGKRLGFEYSLNIVYDTAGAALATPFVLTIYENANLATAIASLQAFITANPTYFASGVQHQIADDANKLRKYSVAMIYNTTGGASANWNRI